MINDLLKKEFSWIKRNTRIVLVALLTLCILLLFSSYLKAIIFTAIFIAAGSVSKIYHRFFRSTLGLDLVFFLTMMGSLVYRNILISFIIGFVGLALADSLAMRFSHTTLISYVSLTAAIVSSTILGGFPIHIALIILTILYELISAFLYNMMGSSLDKIIVFVGSHLIFNLFLIMTFTTTLAAWMS